MKSLRALLIKLYNFIFNVYNKNPKVFILSIFFIIVLVALIFYYSVEITSTVEFCSSCHEMEYSYNTWKKSVHYDEKKDIPIATCRDCHLPPWKRPIKLTYSKIYHGMKDIIKHFTDKDEMKYKGYYFKLKRHAGNTIDNSSCLKCHPYILKKTENNIHYDLKQNKNMKCYACHKNVGHKIINNDQ